MKIKLYQGKTRREALQKVKTDLGRDAVILHTKNVPQRGLMGLLGKQVIEIAATTMPDTARRGRAESNSPDQFHRRKGQLLDIIRQQDAGRAYGATPRRRTSETPPPETDTGPAAHVELSTATPKRRTTASPETVPAAELRREIAAIKSMVDRLVRRATPTGDRTSGLPVPLQGVHARLVEAGFSDVGAREVVCRAADSLTGQQLEDQDALEQALRRELAGLARVAGPLAQGDQGPRVVWLVGPTGVGKTTTIAKLAAEYKLSRGLSVGLITNDTYRIAAVDQLRRYAGIMSVPLKVVLSPGELHEAIDEMAGCDLVLVDTAGRSHRDVMKMNELTDFMSVSPAHEVHLVLNAAGTGAQLGKVVERFRPCGVNRVIFSKIDEAEQYGHLLELLEQTGFAASYLTTGQDVPDDIEVARSEALVGLVLDGGRLDG